MTGRRDPLPQDLRERAALPSPNGRGAHRNGTGTAPGYNLTDLGNAERFVRDHGRDVRYCHSWGKWLVWDGKRWVTDDAGDVERKMKGTVRGIYAEAAEEESERARKALADHAKRSESAKRITDALRLARSEPGIPIKPEQLDADPWFLNAANGTVDLRTGELRSHRREDLITRLAPARYDRDASTSAWDAFLERVLPSEALRGFVRKVIGYAATGAPMEEILVILYGIGANGKSTLVNVIMEVLGDYATQAAPDLLLAKRGSHPTELADLFGARFVASVETDEGRRLAEGLVKQLTGRDPIKARRMREDFWQFDPTHTVFLATNHKPEVRGTDPAIWRRIKLVPFGVTIPEAEQDKKLPERLRAELPGILSWIVRGCLDYQRQGLGEPEDVRQATGEYRAEMDVLASYIEDRCVVDPETWARFSDLWAAYVEWCTEAGEKAETKRRFGARLKERGFEPDRGAGNAPIRRGIGLREDHEPDPGGGSRVTARDESYRSVSGDNPDRYVEFEKESYPSYPKGGMTAQDSSYEGSCRTEGNHGNYGNLEADHATPRGNLSRPLTGEEVQRYRRLVREGMAPRLAQAQVLSKGRP